jgi:hypothetical protein
MFELGNIVKCSLKKKIGKVTAVSYVDSCPIKVEWSDGDFDDYTNDSQMGFPHSGPYSPLSLASPFKVGDKVKELRSGTEGVIVEIDLDEKFYPIFALFPNGRNRYTLDGRAWLKSEKPSLIMVEQVEEDSNSLTTYELQTLQDLVYGRIYPTDCIPEEMLKLGQKLQRKMNSLLSFPRMMAFQSVDGDKWEFLFVTNLERDYDAKGYHRVNNGTLVESIREITAEEKEQILNSLNHQ